MEKSVTLPLNKFAQNLIDYNRLFQIYKSFDTDKQQLFKVTLLDLICQSKCKVNDVDAAITNARMKPTKTCCVIARKGVYYHNLIRVYSADKDEVSICLLANLFKIGYSRRRNEDSKPSKWWNEDLSFETL
jgi:hypothetical protein